MEGNLTQPLLADSREIQNMVQQVLAEAVRIVGLPKLPSWLESCVDFIKLHPWISLLIFLAISTIISAVIREIICSYLKTNEILARLKRLEEKLK